MSIILYAKQKRLYIFADGASPQTGIDLDPRELPGGVVVDYDFDGKLRGVEIPWRGKTVPSVVVSMEE